MYRTGGGNPGTTPVGTVNGSALSFSDTGLSPSTAYSYEVTAIDAVPNESARSSPPATVTTPAAGGGGTVQTFTAAADATIDQASPTLNAGSATRLTADTSPVNQFLLRFNVTGCTSVSAATLSLTVGTTTSDNSTAYGWGQGVRRESDGSEPRLDRGCGELQHRADGGGYGDHRHLRDAALHG